MDFRPYYKRNNLIQKMGFDDYADYLRSHLWAGIRAKVLALENRCRICKDWATCVHHTNYEKDTLTGKNLSGLVPLCFSCHQAGEIDASGNKVDLATANANLELLKKAKQRSKQKAGAKLKSKPPIKKLHVVRPVFTSKCVPIEKPRKHMYKLQFKSQLISRWTDVGEEFQHADHRRVWSMCKSIKLCGIFKYRLVSFFV